MKQNSKLCQYVYGVKLKNTPMLKMIIDRTKYSDGLLWISVELNDGEYILAGPWIHALEKDGKVSKRSQYWLARDYFDYLLGMLQQLGTMPDADKLEQIFVINRVLAQRESRKEFVPTFLS